MSFRVFFADFSTGSLLLLLIVVHLTKVPVSAVFFPESVSRLVGRRRPRDSFGVEKHTGAVEERRDGDGGEEDMYVWGVETDSVSLQARSVNTPNNSTTFTFHDETIIRRRDDWNFNSLEAFQLRLFKNSFLSIQSKI